MCGEREKKGEKEVKSQAERSYFFFFGPLSFEKSGVQVKLLDVTRGHQTSYVWKWHNTEVTWPTYVNPTVDNLRGIRTAQQRF